MSFTFTKLILNDIILIEPKVFRDDRGWFLETYKKSEFNANGIDIEFMQDNHSMSTYGVVRGLHYQLDPKPQGKLIKVIKGVVLDVAVDIRKSSKTYLEWVAVELSEANKKMLYIPPGFAHGFITLCASVDLVYKCTNEYDATLDAGIRWDDPDINIRWPDISITLSEKDKKLPFVKKAQVFK